MSSHEQPQGGRVTLDRITVEFADDNDHFTFDGYTDGRRWNGWECPWFTIGIAERMFERIRYRTRRASVDEAPHGGLWITESGDSTEAPYLMACKMVATIDGDRLLMDLGGWLVFQRRRSH